MTTSDDRILWARLLAASVLISYVGVQLVVYGLTGDPLAAAGAAAIIVAVLYAAYRALRGPWTHAHEKGSMATRTRDRVLVLAVTLAVVWLASQSLGVFVYDTFPAVRESYRTSQSVSDRPWSLLLILLLAPIAEEIVSRGVLYAELRRTMHLPVMVSAVGSGVLFAVMHGNVVQVVTTALLGVFLALAYESTRSILVPIALHMAFNLAAVVTPPALIVSFANIPVLVVFIAGAVVMLAIVHRLIRPSTASRTR